MAITIVADSSPLISFARAKKLEIIRRVYGEIIIPSQVYNEIVVKGKMKPGAEEIQKASWISIQKPKNQFEVEKLKKRFGYGESEAIVLAEELKGILLVDEGAVIREARRRGLEITSTLLILEEAKNKHIIKSVKKEIDELISHGFRTTPELVKNILQRVGE